jgi:hypothetical protein
MFFKFKINYFIILVIFLTMLSCKDKKVPVTKLTAREIYDKNVNKTVTVVTPNGIGSGFFIDKNLIITNYHVIKGENSAEVILNNSDKRIKVLGYLSIDKVNDLILLKIDYNNDSFLEIENKIPSPGDKVFAIGSPIGLNKTISEGIVSGIRSTEKNKLIQITTPISHGSSGCPIINEKGKLIAVAVGGIDGASNIGFCIPSNYINSLIDFKESYSKEISSLNYIKIGESHKDNDIVNKKNETNNENKITKNEKNKNLPQNNINSRFLGKHLFNSYFMDGFRSFGTATIKFRSGKYLLTAYQKNDEGDFIKLNGEIIILNMSEFIFKGNIYVYNHHNVSEPSCEKDLEIPFLEFSHTCWRMKSISNSCFSHTGDIDIFFKTNPNYKETNYP